MMTNIFVAYILILCLFSIHFYRQSETKNNLSTIFALFTGFLFISTLHTAFFLFFFQESKEIQRALPLGLLYGPFLYFAVHSVYKRFHVTFLKIFIHALPFILWLPAYIFFLSSTANRSHFAVEYHIALYICVFLSCFSYSVYCFYKVSKLSHVSQVAMLILSTSIILLIVYSVYILMVVYFVHILEKEVIGGPAKNFILVLRVLVISSIFYKMFQLFVNNYSVIKNKDLTKETYYPVYNDKYKGSQLPLSQLQYYIDKFEYLLYDQKYFLKPNINLTEVAHALSIPPHHLTQLLSRAYGMGLLELVNRMRVEYAGKMIRDNPKMVLAEVAFNAGFSSEATFFRNFKAVKNMTPGQFKEKL